MQLFKTKTFWAGVAALVTAVGTYMTGEATLGEAAQVAFTGLIGIFLRSGLIKTEESVK